MPKTPLPLFKVSIDKIFNTWTALKIAVENGQGDGYGKEIAEWMKTAVEDFFYQNEDLEDYEVAEFLGTIMDQELDTVVDDNSLEDVGRQLCTHFLLCDKGETQKLAELCAQLDVAAGIASSIVNDSKSRNLVAEEEHSSSTEDDEKNESMDVDEAYYGASNGTNMPSTSKNDGNSANVSNSDNTSCPQSHKNGQMQVTDPDEDGWMTVTKTTKHKR